MKQQEQAKQSQNRQSDHFHFDDRALKVYGKRTGVYMGAIKSRTIDGFTRWEDYVYDQSDQISRAKEESENSESDLYIERTELSMSRISEKDSAQEKKQQKGKVNKQVEKVQKSNLDDVSTIRGSERYSKYNQNDRQSNTVKPGSIKSRVSVDRKPFIAPEISTIKRNEVNSRASHSEMGILDMLNHQSKELINEQSKNRKILKEKGDIKGSKRQIGRKMERVEERAVNNRSSQVELKSKKHKKAEFKNENEVKKQSVKYENRQEVQRSNKLEIEEKPQSKRVMFNDKGKIKFPNDSLSYQQDELDNVVPTDFRRHRDSIGKRPYQAVTEVYQSDQQIPYADQPESNQNKEEPRAAAPEHKNSRHNSRDQAVKMTRVQVKNEKRKKPIRLASSNKASTSKGRSNNKKSMPKQKKIVANKEVSKSRAIKSLNESIRRKIKKDGSVVVEEKFISDLNSNNSRPKRYRTNALNFWLSEKPVYSKKGLILGVSMLSAERFLQMLGFDHIHNIKTQRVYFSASRIFLKIILRPGQKIYSYGINYEEMKKEINFAEDYETLRIVQKKQKRTNIKVTIDDLIEEQADQSGFYQVGKEQTFSILNLSQTNACSVTLELQNKSFIELMNRSD